MKKVLLIFIAFSLSLFAMSNNLVHENLNKNSYFVNIKSYKGLVVGDNDMSISVLKDGKPIDGLYKFKVFMPEMPGMPYMEYKSKGKFINGMDKFNVNFSMGGTWQYQLKIKDGSNVVKFNGSFNL